MKIDIISDVVCPWCYIGKKNLEAAMAQRPDIDFEVQWFPYQLHPEAPLEGYNYRQSIESKYGEARIEMMFAQITQVGRASGIEFNLSGIERGANTLKAHRLLDFAFQNGGLDVQNKLSEALFNAYFCDIRDVGSIDELCAIAADVGLDSAEVNTYLNSDEDLDKIEKQINFARQQGVSGVPSFSLDGKFILSGGQQPEVFLSAIDRLAAQTDSEAAPACTPDSCP
ncbi:MAG: DsbA family oxidoreductase [Gammaproteobacteria bacterium]|nr:DsbA family oxidoreductase [Gammaproteobacteria bacterium]MBQ0839225.1 DsbA family oxidoreductase [Gammaproteobacteria bacterium]